LIASNLVVAALLVGCGLLPSTPVHLVTGSPTTNGCFAASTTGLLVADATYGTAIVDMVGMIGPPPGGGPLALAWRAGFTGRQVGSEVEVLDPDGHVVATTGHRYRFEGGYAQIGGTQAFWSCGDVSPT
jgi:hypothetical protein